MTLPHTVASPTAALLLLADGRFPSGGHAHSCGMEEAVADGRVRDLSTLDGFLRGRMLVVNKTVVFFTAPATGAFP